MKIATLAAGSIIAVTACAAVAWAQQPKLKADPATVDKYIAATFKGASEEWRKRIEQDDAQRACSENKNELPTALFSKVLAAEKAKVVLPADGKVIGDWKNGARIAQNGRGGQFSDPPDTVGGGNCYACHQLSKAELSFGTMGPSLNEYGKIRKFARGRCQGRLRQDLQRAVGDAVLEHAAVRPDQGAHRAADQGRGRLSVRS